jgi:hypothetical protein
MKYILLTLVLIAFLATATPAQADTDRPEYLGHRNITGKPDHTAPAWTVKHKDGATCSQAAPANIQPPALAYYMDGDTDPVTAYSDYLEDLAWHAEQFNLCPLQPEPMP